MINLINKNFKVPLCKGGLRGIWNVVGKCAACRINLIVLVICCMFIPFTSSSCQSQGKNQVCFQDQCVDVQVVQTPEEMRKGLQFRSSLAKNAGMLFIFSESRRHSFWMKDTLISLDMIWMDGSQKVVHIARDVPPCQTTPCPTYTPIEPARYVLEVNAGYTDVLKIHVGDKVAFSLK